MQVLCLLAYLFAADPGHNNNNTQQQQQLWYSIDIK